MRELSFTYPQTDFQAWTKACLDEIERASREDALTIADDYTITPGYTIKRTLGPGSSTADALNVVCTFIDDLKKRGTKRTS